MKTHLFSESPQYCLYLLVIWIVLYIMNFRRAYIIPLLLLMFLIFFYRDYTPIVQAPDNIVTSPAQGKVLDVKQKGQDMKISIFLNLHNVHVQKAPLNGKILKQIYKPGSFHPAGLLDKSEHNESLTTFMQTQYGTIKVKQIAGVLVRRIVSWVSLQKTVKRFDNLGMIRFGSRVNLYLPMSRVAKVYVSKGDKINFETFLAQFNAA